MLYSFNFPFNSIFSYSTILTAWASAVIHLEICLSRQRLHRIKENFLLLTHHSPSSVLLLKTLFLVEKKIKIWIKALISDAFESDWKANIALWPQALRKYHAPSNTANTPYHGSLCRESPGWDRGSYSSVPKRQKFPDISLAPNHGAAVLLHTGFSFMSFKVNNEHVQKQQLLNVCFEMSGCKDN